MVWDNRSTAHLAVDDDGDAHRITYLLEMRMSCNFVASWENVRSARARSPVFHVASTVRGATVFLSSLVSLLAFSFAAAVGGVADGFFVFQA